MKALENITTQKLLYSLNHESTGISQYLLVLGLPVWPDSQSKLQTYTVLYFYITRTSTSIVGLLRSLFIFSFSRTSASSVNQLISLFIYLFIRTTASAVGQLMSSARRWHQLSHHLNHQSSNPYTRLQSSSHQVNHQVKHLIRCQVRHQVTPRHRQTLSPAVETFQVSWFYGFYLTMDVFPLW